MIDKEVKHDVFIERSIWFWDWVKSHGSAISWAIVLILFAGMLLTVLRNAREARRRLAWDRLATLSVPDPGEKPSGVLPGPSDARVEDWLRQFRGTDAEPWILLEQAARRLSNGRANDAENDYRRIAGRFPGHCAGAWARIGLGACLEASGKIEDARREYEAVRAAGTDPAATDRATEAIRRLNGPAGTGGRRS